MEHSQGGTGSLVVAAQRSRSGRYGGRHAARGRPSGIGKLGLAGIVIALSSALAAAFAFVPTGSAPHTAAPGLSETTQFSTAHVSEMAHATPAQRKAIDRAIVESFGRYGQA